MFSKPHISLASLLILSTALVLSACGEEKPAVGDQEPTADSSTLSTYEGDGFSIKYPEDWKAKDMDEEVFPLLTVLTPLESDADLAGISILEHPKDTTLGAYEIILEGSPEIASSDLRYQMSLGAWSYDIILLDSMDYSMDMLSCDVCDLEEVELADGTAAFKNTQTIMREAPDEPLVQISYYVPMSNDEGIYSLFLLIDESDYEARQEEIDEIMQSFEVQ